jgi:ribosomal protein S12 methylthiotransferase
MYSKKREQCLHFERTDIKKDKIRTVQQDNGCSVRNLLEKNMELVGKSFKALVDDVDNEIAVARLSSQAPEIDGVVLIHDNTVKKGSFVNVKIEEAYDYDLKGTVLL